MSGVNSSIINDGVAGSEHEYNASISMPNLSSSDFKTILATAKNIATNPYDLNDNNCANFALNVFNSIRASTNAVNSVVMESDIYVPVASYFAIYFSQSPAGLYQTLVRMKNTNTPDAPNIEIGVNRYASTSKGECN